MASGRRGCVLRLPVPAGQTWLRGIQYTTQSGICYFDTIFPGWYPGRDDAFERAVDRLLASPKFGEHLAARWLEAARYADTSGYQADWERHMWPWRDWVINAFNADMPFDQFTIEQLAGDLLPDPTHDQVIATAFNRNHRINDELGSLDAEFQVEYVADRVDTTSTVWLGLTMACARCHDHKYDPVSTVDYYSMFAFFNAVPEKGVDGRIGHSKPAVDVRHPDPKVHEAHERAQAAYEQARATYEGAGSDWHTARKKAIPALRAGKALWARKAPMRIKNLVAATELNDQQARAIDQYIRRNAPQWAKPRRAFNTRKREMDQARARAIVKVMVMQDAPNPRPTYVLRRGAYDQPDRSRPVAPAIPAAFGTLDGSKPANRLAFARWLVDGEHPLTSRVIVNRFWMHLFGRGIVATPEDFGSQGARPTHPELLDWLAAAFVADGWSVKRLLRRIVTSATYRQSSVVTEIGRRRDPQNLRLSRAPRIRLSAFQLRDQALAVSGLLVPRIGGPSVKTYQPSGLWAEVSFQDKKRNTDFYVQGTGEALRRRSLYTFWKRSVNPPFMTNFDGATREACSVRFSRTNTPLQALNLLNDVTFVEAAKHLAARLLAEEGGFDARVTRAFDWLGTSATEEVIGVLRSGHADALAHYRGDREAAALLAKHGETPLPWKVDAVELAAMTYVTSVVLNLDAVIVRE